MNKPNVNHAATKHIHRPGRGAKMHTHNGVTLSQRQWADLAGISDTTLSARLRAGCSFERAIDPAPLPGWNERHAAARLRAKLRGRSRSAYTTAVTTGVEVAPDPRQRTCAHRPCGRPFISRPGQRITCSPECRAAFVADWPHEIDEVG